VGHEYWLTEYQDILKTSSSTDEVVTAIFNYPTGSGSNKQVDNTFLWDYYYRKNYVGEENNPGPDANADTYQTRYKESRSMTDYPLLATATPYMIGFPGKTFYEFDLSGEWKVKNTAPTAPAQLGKQTISFVSIPGISIGISDDEMSTTAINGYQFMPNYMSKPVTGYLMNQDGNQFDQTPAGGAAPTPFRPYFIKAASSNQAPRSISFDSSFVFGEDDDPSGDNFGDGDLAFTIHRRTISVTSSLQSEAVVNIYNVSGLIIANFTIQPGQTVQTNIPLAGVYIIRADNSRIHKKIAIK
jgi:hypothetical protein